MRLIYIAFGWAAGLILAAGPVTLPPVIWGVLAITLVGVVVFTWRDEPFRLINIVLLAFVLGGLRMAFVPTMSQVAVFNNTGGLTLTGQVDAAPDRRDTGTQFRLRVERVIRGGEVFAVEGLVLVRANRSADVRYGDAVRVTGALITPAEFDTFSYADFLARTGVFSIMTNASVTVLERGGGNPISAGLLNARDHAATIINANLPEPSAGLLAGMLLGDRRGMSPELSDDFSIVGASHLIVISGFNMAILAGLLAWIFSGVGFSGRMAALAGIALIFTYALFVGGSPGVMRAAIMSSLLLTAPLLRRRTYVPASLALAAVLMSLHTPTVLWDVSFQMSFFATLGLALFVEPLSRGFQKLLARIFPSGVSRRLANWLEGPVVVTVAAQIMTMPLIALYFGRMSLVFLPASLFLIPIHPVQLILGGAATITASIAPALGQIVFWLEYLVLSWTITVVRMFASLPFAAADFTLDSHLVTLYFGGIMGWGILTATRPDWWRSLNRFVRRRVVVITLSACALGLALLMTLVAFSRPDGDLHVWFLDVGHNNAVLIQTPGGAHILVDGGRFPSRLLTALGDRLPFNDRHLDVLVITRPDEFTTGALPAVLERYTTGVVLTNGQDNLSAEHQALTAALAGREVTVVHAGYSIEIEDGTRLDVLHPRSRPALGESMDANALTLRLTYGDVSILLAGPLSRDGQAALLANGGWPLATVLQLPGHGGARTLDAAFLEAVQPAVAVVQIDPANRRGDPDPATLALLGDTPVFRTDHDGALHLRSDGESLWISGDG